MKSLSTLLLLLPLTVAANNTKSESILESFKNQPVSKYDIGYVQLSIFSMMATEKLKGEHARGSEFDYSNVLVHDENNELGLKFTFVGRSKHLTAIACEQLLNSAHMVFKKKELAKSLWRGLSESDYKKLTGELTYKAELIDESNASLKITC